MGIESGHYKEDGEYYKESGRCTYCGDSEHGTSSCPWLHERHGEKSEEELKAMVEKGRQEDERVAQEGNVADNVEGEKQIVEPVFCDTTKEDSQWFYNLLKKCEQSVKQKQVPEEVQEFEKDPQYEMMIKSNATRVDTAMKGMGEDMWTTSEMMLFSHLAKNAPSEYETKIRQFETKDAEWLGDIISRCIEAHKKNEKPADVLAFEKRLEEKTPNLAKLAKQISRTTFETTKWKTGPELFEACKFMLFDRLIENKKE